MMMKLANNLALTAALLLLLPTTSAQTPCTTDADCLASQGFCGRDAVCHAHSGCQEWFTFGSVQFTGYEDNSAAVTLNCEDYTTGFADNANGITFGCRPYAFGKKAPEGTLCCSVCLLCFAFHYFWWPSCCTCLIISLHYHAFPQHQLSPHLLVFQTKDNTDYSDFLGETARFSVESCDRETFENEQPLFWYIKEASDGGSATYGNGRENTFSTDSFNPSEADKAFYSTLGAVGGSSGSGGDGGGGSSGGVQHSLFSSLVMVSVAAWLGMSR